MFTNKKKYVFAIKRNDAEVVSNGKLNDAEALVPAFDDSDTKFQHKIQQNAVFPPISGQHW